MDKALDSKASGGLSSHDPQFCSFLLQQHPGSNTTQCCLSHRKLTLMLRLNEIQQAFYMPDLCVAKSLYIDTTTSLMSWTSSRMLLYCSLFGCRMHAFGCTRTKCRSGPYSAKTRRRKQNAGQRRLEMISSCLYSLTTICTARKTIMYDYDNIHWKQVVLFRRAAGSPQASGGNSVVCSTHESDDRLVMMQFRRQADTHYYPVARSITHACSQKPPHICEVAPS